MGGPLSVTLADIHLIRTENDAVKPFKPVFYKQYDDDIYNRRNLLQKLLQKTEEQKLLFIEKVTNCPCHGRQIYPNAINETQLTQNYIVQKDFLQTLVGKFTELKRSF